MTMFKMILRDYVFIDPGQEIMYGSDQMYVDCPRRFATVGFQLVSTVLLSSIADRIRKDIGLAPMAPMDEYTDETCDNDDWYDFYYGINDLDGGRGDGCITFIVANSDSPDNEEIYTKGAEING